MMSRTNASGTRPNASGTRARPNASMRPPLNKGDALRDASADTTSMRPTLLMGARPVDWPPPAPAWFRPFMEADDRRRAALMWQGKQRLALSRKRRR